MKIVRFLSHDEAVLYGIFDPEHPNKARIIDGDIFGDMEITGQTQKIARILPPLDPPNIFALGFSYGKHAEETDVQYPENPVVFLKATNSLIGDGSPIILPAAGPDEVDYEAELAVVIGREARNVSPEDAMKYILGYTCGNDVSARDWQFHKQKNQWARGKSFDTFCPLGPCLVTADEVGDPNNLRIQLILNGGIMQDSSTSYMIFDIAAVVSDLSRSLTLLPGTVIMTGTPEGVGFTREPPIFLKDGDIVTVRIEGIGQLTNPVMIEQ